MTTNTNNNIKAKVRTDKPDNNWTKAKDDSTPKKTYYYMFTGGYLFDSSTNTIGRHTQNEDEGPAGEVEILADQTSFNIAVEDSTGKGFKIKAWDLSGDGDLNETFTPAPGVDLPTPVSNQTITVGAEGANQKNKYKGYYVTLVDSEGYQIELDPRVYEKR
jgi:hypothetical protein